MGGEGQLRSPAARWPDCGGWCCWPSGSGAAQLCSCFPRKCVSVCPLGYFGDTAARRCRRCHKGCETCSGRSPTQCLSCRRGFYHQQETNTCVTLCPNGFYADESKCVSWGIEVMSEALPRPGVPSPAGVFPASASLEKGHLTGREGEREGVMVK